MYILNRDNVSIINTILKEEKFNITAWHRRITRCKRLRFASSKFGLRRTSFTSEPVNAIKSNYYKKSSHLKRKKKYPFLDEQVQGN
jgi:hypothetical protein